MSIMPADYCILGPLWHFCDFLYNTSTVYPYYWPYQGKALFTNTERRLFFGWSNPSRLPILPKRPRGSFRYLLELIHADPTTPFEIISDGRSLLLTPIRDDEDEKKFEDALAMVHKRFGNAMKKLAE